MCTPFRKTLSKILLIQTDNSSDTWLKKFEALPSSGLSRFTDEILLNRHGTYRKEQLCFCTAAEVSTFLILVQYIYRCTNNSTDSLSRAVSNRFFNKMKIYTNTWTVSKTLILHQGNKIQHLHRSEIILSREPQETIWEINVSENILIHTTFYNTLLWLRLEVSPEPNTLSLLYLAPAYICFLKK